MKGDISPPPLKRQKLIQTSSSTETAGNRHHHYSGFTLLCPPTPGTLRIFSWNVNGIAPFVQPYLQRSIKSFFMPSTAAGSTFSAARKRRRQGDGEVTSDSEGNTGENPAGEKGTEDPAKEGPASLRLVLRRYGWPHILFLQEIKIKPGDSKTMGAVRQAVNDMPGPSRMKPCEAGAKSMNPIPTEHTDMLGDGGPEYEVHFNLPADPYNAKGFGGKVYGVAAIIRRDFSSQYVQKVRDVQWNREGRIQIVETRRITLPLRLHRELPAQMETKHDNSASTSGCKFAIINIYAVNGTSNPYRSTHTGVEVGTRHDRKLAVHRELLCEALALEAQGFHVVIAGDLNIARSELDGYPNLRTKPYQHVLNRNDFNKKFFSKDIIIMTPSTAAYRSTRIKISEEREINGFNGIDTFRLVHGRTRKYSYHGRGIPWGSSCDRVDLIIASRALSQDITNAGIYDSPRDRGPSDHCPVWVEIGAGSYKTTQAQIPKLNP